MSGLEDRLREAYLDLAELATEEAVPAWAPARRAASKRSAVRARGGTRPGGRGWGMAPIAAAAAVAAIAVAAGVIVPRVLSEQHHGRHAQTNQSQRPPHRTERNKRPAVAVPGLPEFAVVSTGTSLQVVRTATGRMIGQVSVPGAQGIDQIAGDASDRTFYVSTQQGDPTAPCRAYFYRLSLSADGQVSALTPLPGTAQPGGLPTALAASADGRKLAFSVVKCADGSGTIPPSQVIGGITVLDEPSGKITRRWTYTQGEDYTPSMSLTPNGNLLAFAMYLPGGSAIVAKQLSTDTPSGTVDQASTVVGLPGVVSLSLGPALYGCVGKDRPHGQVNEQLGAYDPATGRRKMALHTWRDAACYLAPNAVNGHVLVVITTGSAGVYTGSVFAVDVRTGRRAELPIAVSTDPASVAIGW